MISRSSRSPLFWSAMACAAAGFGLFQFFGNAGRGYIDTGSLFYWWGYQWLNPASETEHGWVILGVSGWLMWRQGRQIAARGSRIADSRKPETGDRKSQTGSEDGAENEEGRLVAECDNPQSAIRSPKPSIPWVALFSLIFALLLHLAGFVAQQARISIVALLVFTWGVIRLAGGRRAGNAAVFPLAFMVFAIPVSMLDEVGLPLRLWVTAAGEKIAHVAGIPVLRSGTQLLAPDGRFNYDVAAPCSGVRSLMALAALSLLIGYLNFRTWWRRALVFAGAFPLVYLGNVARIVAIVLAAQWGGPKWGGWAHEVMGYGVFVIVLGGVWGLVGLIARGWPETPVVLAASDAREADERTRASASTGSSAARPVATVEANHAKLRRMGWVVAGLMLGLVVIEMELLRRFSSLPPRGDVGVRLAADGLNPVELPAFVGSDWIGQRIDVSAVEREILPPDTGFSRKNYVFLGNRNQSVFLSIVLSGRDRTSIHRPELCLVGQGWTIQGAGPQAFRAGGEGGGPLPATLLRVRREIATPHGKVAVPQLVAYWFVGGDTVVASHWGRFFTDSWNRLARGRVDRWAYVLLQTDMADGEAAALARMQAVLDGTLPTFQRVAVTQ